MGKKFIKTDKIELNLKTSKPYTVISLFSGAGGKDLGVIGNFQFLNRFYGSNNFEIIYANDIEKNACLTYNKNFKHESINKDIRFVNEKQLPKADIVIGGFPCQDFSLAGKREGLNSSRGILYLEMKRVIQEVKPKIFVAENVEGLTNLNGNETLEKIINDLQSVGYFVEHLLLNAANFGVPQNRKRVFIIGIRNDINTKNEVPYPAETHGENKIKIITSKDAIEDLWNKIDSPYILNHSSKDYSKAKFYEGKKMQGNIKINPDKPAPTIRSEHHGNIEGHYRTFDDNNPGNINNWRRLTVREVARLQTFPDNFIFPVSASSAYKQIGNAVPPVLAWHIFRSINIYLNNILV